MSEPKKITGSMKIKRLKITIPLDSLPVKVSEDGPAPDVELTLHLESGQRPVVARLNGKSYRKAQKAVAAAEPGSAFIVLQGTLSMIPEMGALQLMEAGIAVQLKAAKTETPAPGPVVGLTQIHKGVNQQLAQRQQQAVGEVVAPPLFPEQGFTVRERSVAPDSIPAPFFTGGEQALAEPLRVTLPPPPPLPPGALRPGRRIFTVEKKS